jgi:hypothetical protein
VTCRAWSDAYLGRAEDEEVAPAVRPQPGDAGLVAFAEAAMPGVPLGLWPGGEGGRRGRAADAEMGTLGLLSISLRSPESIILYLGEIAGLQGGEGEVGAGGPRFLTDASYDAICAGRCRMPAAGTTPACDGGRELLVIGLRRGAATAEPLAAVEYMGARYWIPAGGGGEEGSRTSETLSVVSALLSLYRSAADLPRAVPVRILPD